MLQHLSREEVFHEDVRVFYALLCLRKGNILSDGAVVVPFVEKEPYLGSALHDLWRELFARLRTSLTRGWSFESLHVQVFSNDAAHQVVRSLGGDLAGEHWWKVLENVHPGMLQGRSISNGEES